MVDARRCECGSGLRFLRCCGLDVAALSPAGSAYALLPLAQEAAHALREDDAERAERLCLEVLELAPAQPLALETLQRLRQAQGAGRAAQALLSRQVALHPNDAAPTCELALQRLRAGDLAQAERHARNAVRIAPLDPQPHNLMGMVLTEAHRLQAGEHHYRRVLELTGRRDPILLANLAWNLRMQGRIEEARALYRESAAEAPDVLQTLLGWARMEEADRDFDAAAGLLARAETVAPHDGGVQLALALLHGRTRDHAGALARLDALAARNGGRLSPDELLERGRVLDRLGRYDEAFEDFRAAKRRAIEEGAQLYRAAEAEGLAARLHAFFTQERLAFTPRATLVQDLAQPIFILGFPRSGTTLVEQTLSMHPRICAGDELPLVCDVAERVPQFLSSQLPYPEALAELWMGDHHLDLDVMRDHYLREAARMVRIGHEARWFTDKMPVNETHLGLIALMFPRSPLIHVVRHPLDVVLSVFSNRLTHGFMCASGLESAARHYVLVMELVEHYRAEMALRYLPVRYEDMVDDHEGSVRRILDFVGEEFDPRCLAFHESRRHARTASYAQVTEKLYRASRYRHRHYRVQLEPLLPVLGPVIERLGYEVAWERPAC